MPSTPTANSPFLNRCVDLFLRVPMISDRAHLRTQVARLCEQTDLLRESSYLEVQAALKYLDRTIVAAKNRDALLERRELGQPEHITEDKL